MSIGSSVLKSATRYDSSIADLYGNFFQLPDASPSITRVIARGVKRALNLKHKGAISSKYGRYSIVYIGSKKGSSVIDESDFYLVDDEKTGQKYLARLNTGYSFKTKVKVIPR